MDPQARITTFQLFELFPDEETARKYLEARLWPDGVTCPACRSRDRIGSVKGRAAFYRCYACTLAFTVRTGTIFERSHVPLHKWIYALYFYLIYPKIPVRALAPELGVTSNSAAFVLKRLRAGFEGKSEKRGLAEVAAAFVGAEGITKETSERLARYFGNSPEFWKNVRF